jgi:hypothetical protein
LGVFSRWCVHSLLVEEEGKNEGIRTERIKKGEKEKKTLFQFTHACTYPRSIREKNLKEKKGIPLIPHIGEGLPSFFLRT